MRLPLGENGEKELRARFGAKKKKRYKLPGRLNTTLESRVWFGELRWAHFSKCNQTTH